MFGAGLLMSAPTQAAIDPVILACPNRQTTLLTGNGAQPGSSLIAYLRTRAVAGGSVGPTGAWSIPLKPNERPGIYDVEVKLRGTLSLVARFTCYIDVALDATDTPEPTLASTATPTIPTVAVPQLPTATLASGTATATLTSGTATTTRTASTATGTGTITVTTTAGTATRTPTGTITVTTTAGTATTTTTAQAGAINIKINDVVCRKPTDDPTFEYVELVNKGSNEVDLSGWKIVNITQGNAAYTFPVSTPAYKFPAGPDVYVVVYGGIGSNRLDIGEFYWGNNTQIWHIGDKVELRNASSQVVTSLTVPADSCS
jgi:hypothetical protein